MKKYILIIIVLGLSSLIYKVAITQKRMNTALELPDGAPEILLTLNGTLKLKYWDIPGEEAHSGYVWFLELDKPSFKKALETPVWGYALPLKEILEQSNRYDVQFCPDEDTEDFCQNHIDQKVTIEGFLFHAHTGHHHAPLLMDLKAIYQSSDGAIAVQ
ncbi:MAG: DUF4431 domain-containing protein [Chlamydiales bacterium]|nr:DUF4431 domain-containing protein [Chlamydiales bacterium]